MLRSWCSMIRLSMCLVWSVSTDTYFQYLVLGRGLRKLLTVTRRYRIHPDARRPLSSQRPHKVGHCSLGRAVEGLRQGLVGPGLVDDLRAHGGCNDNRTATMIPVNPKSVIFVWVSLPKILRHGGATYFAAALALLNTPSTLTEYTLWKSSLVNSRAGLTTETPAF
jgi:hypothetical protein